MRIRSTHWPYWSCGNGNRPTSSMLKKTASIVLASLRGSTYRSVRLASSLAAALLDSLIEHPDALLTLTPLRKILVTTLQMILPSLLVLSLVMGAD